MSLLVMTRGLAHQCRRRIGFGWMATAMFSGGLPRGTAGARLASTEFISGDSYRAMKELTTRMQLSEHTREPRADPLEDPSMSPETETNSESINVDSKRRQRELAIGICQKYSRLPSLKLPLSTECERAKILMMLASECSTTDDNVQKAVAHFTDRNQTSTSTILDTLAIFNLRKACTPLYEEVLEYILTCDTREAIPFLLKLREDTLRALQWIRSSATEDDRLPQLEDLDAYLLRLFTIWFNPGMLELKRITYEGTPASVIEFIATKEAVHPMKSLDDLRIRLGAGRRVLSLFHPMLDNQPLLFVHVALTHEIPSSMEEVMELLPHERPSCATFYSITNAQPGLAGIGLGEHLLKASIQVRAFMRLQIPLVPTPQKAIFVLSHLLHAPSPSSLGSLIVQFLQSEFPSLVTFVTLSPMPKFRKRLEEKMRQNDENGNLFRDSILSKDEWNSLVSAGLVSSTDTSWKSFLACLDKINFFSESGDQGRLAVLEPILTKLAARYIVLEKHRGKPFDGVARFHLGNGAAVDRINFGADLSRKGVQNSFGIMVNYLYDLDFVADNRRTFERTHQVQTSSEVQRLIAVEDGYPGRSKL